MKKYLVIPLQENRHIKLLFINDDSDIWTCKISDESLVIIAEYFDNGFYKLSKTNQIQFENI
jgi:hypothetical protein